MSDDFELPPTESAVGGRIATGVVHGEAPDTAASRSIESMTAGSTPPGKPKRASLLQVFRLIYWH